MLNEQPESVLSAADLAAVEKEYRKITTPWRCRLGWHEWGPWALMLGVQFGAIQTSTGRRAAPIQLNLSLRICLCCTKVQARAVRDPHPVIVEEGDDREED